MPSSVPDETRLWDLVFGHLGYRALLVAHELGVFELLAEAPRTLASLCEALGIEQRAGRALLAPCAAGGLLEVRDGVWTLGPVARAYLVRTSPTYFGSFLDLLAANDEVSSHAAMRSAVRENRSQVYGGDPLFASHEAEAIRARAFTRGMHGHSAGAARAWPDALDLAGHRTLLDVGGGSGVHALAAAARWPGLRAIVFDRRAVLDVAREVVAAARMEDRVAVHEGDLWTDAFPAADVHFYADILHDWPIEKGRFLARKSFDALPSGGRIVVHEILFEGGGENSAPFAAAAYNVAMLLWTEGQQYSAEGLVALLAESGFVDVAARRSFGYWSVVTGRKP